MKRLIVLLILLFFMSRSFATHIAGGELIYEYLGLGSTAKSKRFKITMRLFRECNPPLTSTGTQAAPLNGETVVVGIYEGNSFGRVTTLPLNQDFSGNPPVIQYIPGTNPCVTGNPEACYQVGTYSNTIELRDTAAGYILSWIRYTRTSLANAVSNAGTGGTYTTYIPGTTRLPTGFNNSPQFAIKNPDIICRQTNFVFDFSATDSDNDSLSYKFVPAYDGAAGTSFNTPNPAPPSSLQIFELGYNSPYSGASPLGPNVVINPLTGIITGTAPPAGKYVVCIVVEEWRNGVMINNHRKDFLLNIGDCSLTAAALKPTYTNCKDLNFAFLNESTNTNIQSYLWDFGVPNTTTDTSHQPTPTFTYPAVGDYVLFLKVVAAGGCVDSATAIVKAYPGFTAGFNVTGTCFQNPILFNDATTAVHGFVNSWRWNFGDVNSIADTSHAKDTSWKYSLPSATKVSVQLIAGSSKGCIDTSLQLIDVSDKPTITLPFKDTLICSIDDLKLIANSTGSYSWTSVPASIMLNSNTSTPTVSPKDTTTYYVTVNNSGCINTDSIKVNVLDFINVNAGPDTLICTTDTLQLKTISDALSYSWTASSGETVAAVKRPTIKPLVNTTYSVLANLGKCPARDTIVVSVTPYPVADAGTDAAICYGNRVQLNASYVGTNFTWSPTSTLFNGNTTTPVAGPQQTTSYIFTANDTLPGHCPKPKRDTIVVTVVPPIYVNAGRDTSVVINQPLQFNAKSTIDAGIHSYLWKPASGLNNDTINNPIGVYNITNADAIKYIVRATDNNGCFGEDDILVKIFKSSPDILVPSAFTPNRDGINDIIRPIPLGIININYFNVYNRWGQLLYSTTELNKGWDGNFNGEAQPAGTYVFMVLGVDFTGKSIFRKGTVVLIR